MRSDMQKVLLGTLVSVLVSLGGYSVHELFVGRHDDEDVARAELQRARALTASLEEEVHFVEAGLAIAGRSHARVSYVAKDLLSTLSDKSVIDEAQYREAASNLMSNRGSASQDLGSLNGYLHFEKTRDGAVLKALQDIVSSEIDLYGSWKEFLDVKFRDRGVPLAAESEYNGIVKQLGLHLEHVTALSASLDALVKIHPRLGSENDEASAVARTALSRAETRINLGFVGAWVSVGGLAIVAFWAFSARPKTRDDLTKKAEVTSPADDHPIADNQDGNAENTSQDNRQSRHRRKA